VTKISVDAGARYALIDRKDPDHADIRACLNAHQGRLVASDYILDETLTLLRYRLGGKAAQAFRKNLLSGDIALLHDLTRKHKNIKKRPGAFSASIATKALALRIAHRLRSCSA
jgi:predicted nucleic acid-binding protein